MPGNWDKKHLITQSRHGREFSTIEQTRELPHCLSDFSYFGQASASRDAKEKILVSKDYSRPSLEGRRPRDFDPWQKWIYCGTQKIQKSKRPNYLPKVSKFLCSTFIIGGSSPKWKGIHGHPGRNGFKLWASKPFSHSRDVASRCIKLKWEKHEQEGIARRWYY